VTTKRELQKKFPQLREEYRTVVRTRSARVRIENQMLKNNGKTTFRSANSNSATMNKNFTIPVIVQGQALTSKNNNVRTQISKPPHRRDNKLLIVGDSHARLCATKVKSKIKGSFDDMGIVKPGAGAGVLVNTANSDVANLTKSDVIILCGGSNDIAKNDSKTAMRHIRNFINSNSHTNIVLVSVPHRYDLMQSSCVNNEIKSFSRKLLKHAKAHQHVSILEISDDRKLCTTHGLHLDGLGKGKLSKQIVSLTYTILAQKKDPPIILSWNSDQSHSDTLHQGNVNRVSTRTKKTPINQI
jgi:hypothetical protein